MDTLLLINKNRQAPKVSVIISYIRLQANVIRTFTTLKACVLGIIHMHTYSTIITVHSCPCTSSVWPICHKAHRWLLMSYCQQPNGPQWPARPTSHPRAVQHGLGYTRWCGKGGWKRVEVFWREPFRVGEEQVESRWEGQDWQQQHMLHQNPPSRVR